MSRPARAVDSLLLRRPAAAVVLGFAVAAAIGCAVLLLPAATTDGVSADPVIAIFTSVSALFGGLVVVDTPTYWSTLGEVAILVEFEDDFAMVKTVAPREIVGRPLDETRIRAKHGITVVGVKRPGHPFTYATQDTVVHADDLVIVSGRIDAVEAFANRG